MGRSRSRFSGAVVLALAALSVAPAMGLRGLGNEQMQQRGGIPAQGFDCLGMIGCLLTFDCEECTGCVLDDNMDPIPGSCIKDIQGVLHMRCEEAPQQQCNNATEQVKCETAKVYADCEDCIADENGVLGWRYETGCNFGFSG